MGPVETHISGVYNGEYSPVRVSVKASTGNTLIEYRVDGDDWQDDEYFFRNVDDNGIGKVQCRINTDNYAEVTGALDISITSASLNVIPSVSPSSVEYDTDPKDRPPIARLDTA